MAGQFHRAGAAGVGDGHHYVDFVQVDVLLHFFCQRHAHVQPCLIHRHAVNHGIGARKINIFEQTGLQDGGLGALARMEIAGKVDEDGLAGSDIAPSFVIQSAEYDAFAGDGISGFTVLLLRADDERADAVGVAEGHHTVARNHRHHAVSAAHTLVHFGDGVENIVKIQAGRVFVGGYFAADFVGEHIEQHFAVGLRIDVAQIFGIHLLRQFGGIGQIAVVCQYDAEGRADIKRLCLGRAARIARGGVAHMGNARVAVQIAHIPRAEDFAHHAFAFVHVEAAVLRGHNPGGILSAVLQHLQAVIK